MKTPKIYYHLHDIELGYIPEGKENWLSLEELRDHLADQLYSAERNKPVFNEMSLDELCIYAGYELHTTGYKIK